eukprot:c20636_g7_i1.p1 GENE.c20636_g7_i1~~c20636_g7_i1.p1  ORF type:complete len:757 (-),score=96.01 c20636_g7_i1:72-2342(-)
MAASSLAAATTGGAGADAEAGATGAAAADVPKASLSDQARAECMRAVQMDSLNRDHVDIAVLLKPPRMVNRTAEALEFAVINAVNNHMWRIGRVDGGNSSPIGIPIALQMFGAGKTFFGRRVIEKLSRMQRRGAETTINGARKGHAPHLWPLVLEIADSEPWFIECNSSETLAGLVAPHIDETFRGRGWDGVVAGLLQRLKSKSVLLHFDEVGKLAEGVLVQLKDALCTLFTKPYSHGTCCLSVYFSGRVEGGASELLSQRGRGGSPYKLYRMLLDPLKAKNVQSICRALAVEAAGRLDLPEGAFAAPTFRYCFCSRDCACEERVAAVVALLAGGVPRQIVRLLYFMQLPHIAALMTESDVDLSQRVAAVALLLTANEITLNEFVSIAADHADDFVDRLVDDIVSVGYNDTKHDFGVVRKQAEYLPFHLVARGKMRFVRTSRFFARALYPAFVIQCCDRAVARLEHNLGGSQGREHDVANKIILTLLRNHMARGPLDLGLDGVSAPLAAVLGSLLPNVEMEGLALVRLQLRTDRMPAPPRGKKLTLDHHRAQLGTTTASHLYMPVSATAPSADVFLWLSDSSPVRLIEFQVKAYTEQTLGWGPKLAAEVDKATVVRGAVAGDVASVWLVVLCDKWSKYLEEQAAAAGGVLSFESGDHTVERVRKPRPGRGKRNRNKAAFKVTVPPGLRLILVSTAVFRSWKAPPSAAARSEGMRMDEASDVEASTYSLTSSLGSPRKKQRGLEDGDGGGGANSSSS